MDASTVTQSSLLRSSSQSDTPSKLGSESSDKIVIDGSPLQDYVIKLKKMVDRIAKDGMERITATPSEKGRKLEEATWDEWDGSEKFYEDKNEGREEEDKNAD
jgi:hypothetical protein